jgi:murein L,D-transpeptidase YcbB/YkuD
MTRMPQSAVVVLMLAALIGCSAVSAQSPAHKSARALDLDAAPSGISTPDPLAPPDTTAPAPIAPGAPPVAPQSKAAAEADPIVVLVRERLATRLNRASAAERDDYAGLAAFYADGNGLPVWTSETGFTQRAELAIAEIRKADDWGLKASDFDLPSAPVASATTSSLADAEVKLGLAVLKYGRQARGGRVDPSLISRMFDQKPAIYDPKSLMQAIAATESAAAYLRGLHPTHPQFHRLREALLAARGAKTQSEGAEQSVRIPRGPRISPGQEHPHVGLVRQRLAAASEAGKESLYDGPLVEEVKTFQRRSDLEPTGFIDGALRNALNGTARAPAKENVARLIANMERWRWLPADLGEFYVWDSVPEQMTSVYAQDKQVLSEKLVVGKPSTPTPIFSANMQFVIFHPSWGVPPGMKTQELWPQLRNTGGWFFGTSASSVLGAHGLQVSRGGRPIDPDSVNWQSADIRGFEFTQPPGPRNVLGIVKFRFPNRHDVYMHDTPERNLFGGAVRAFSHGCMRVQNPIKLAEVVLAHDKGWSSDMVQEYVRHGGEIKLDKPIPVHITYFTVTIDASGKQHNHGDIYGLDGRLASALEGRAVHLASAAVAPEPRSSDAGDEQQSMRKKSRRVRQKSAPTFNPFSW